MKSPSDAPVRAPSSADSSLSTMGELALEHVRAGFHVLPLNGKIPIVDGGAHAGTRDEGQVRAWWTASPHANIGLAMGKPWPSGGFLAGVDIDRRHGGQDVFAEVEGPAHVETRTHASGDDGAHLIYLTRGAGPMPGFVIARGPDGKSKAVELKGEPGYLVAPGSVHPDTGKLYSIADGRDPVDAPQWLYSAYLRHAESGRGGTSAFTAVPMAKDHPRYAARFEKGRTWAREAPAAADGTAGTDTIWDLAIKLVRTLELHDDDARALIEQEFNRRATDSNGREWPWSAKEIEHKIEQARHRSAIECGLSEGTSDGLNAYAERSPKMRAGARPLPKETERKKKSPEHEYRYEVGHVVRSDLKTTNFPSLCNDLRTLKDWRGVFSYDVLAERVVAVDPPIRLRDCENNQGFSEVDASAIACWFACAAGQVVSHDMIHKAVDAVAQEIRFNPFEDYLQCLPEVEPGAIAELCDMLGQTDALDRAYVRKILLASVRRALRPGHKSDSALLLRGKPGANKSSFVPALFSREWTAENMPDLGDAKACGEVMAGRLAVELPELGSLFTTTKGRNDVIQFMTRTTETFRGAYERGKAKAHKRSCTFFGTVNPVHGSEIYRDVDGADVRRFWIIDVDAIDIAWIRANRDRIWYEAYEATFGDEIDEDRLTAGEAHWLSDEEVRKHEERSGKSRELDDWTPAIRKYSTGKPWVDIDNVWTVAIGGELERLTQKESRRIAKVLRALGWESRSSNGERHWYPIAKEGALADIVEQTLAATAAAR